MGQYGCLSYGAVHQLSKLAFELKMTVEQTDFTYEQFTPTAITATNPVTVTIPDQTFTQGQAVRFTKFYQYPLATSPGMYQLNNNLYYIGFVTGNTFTLTDVNSVGIDGRNFQPFVSTGQGQMTLTGPSLYVQNNIAS